MMKNSLPKHLSSLRSLVTAYYSLTELKNMGIQMIKNKFGYSRKIKNKKATLKKQNGIKTYHKKKNK